MEYQAGKPMPMLNEDIINVKRYKGYIMVLVDGPLSINGYVVIKPNQKGFKHVGNYTDTEDINCHGGITFDGPDPNGNRVIGFDTAHGDDMAGDTSWDDHKLFNQCRLIVNQLIK